MWCRQSDKTLAAIHALAPAPRVYPSSHAMEDCCAICAEPLTHVAYGPCGHKDACVECVARLRFVLDDRRCVICQVSCERVFATRHMGEYTETIGADGFEALPKKARAGQLHHDEKLDMFFDDDAVCGKVKALRSLVCGECVRDAGGDAGVVTAALERQGSEGAHAREARQVLLRGLPRGPEGVPLRAGALHTRTAGQASVRRIRRCGQRVRSVRVQRPPELQVLP